MASKSVGVGGGGVGSRGRPYGIMLFLAVGAAVFAVMLLHKMREKRIFNIIITEKDHNLLTLQLLLQKERDSTEEMKKKIEKLKAKAEFLRSQKRELSDKLMELKSINSSLREEQRTLESALEEKENNIKMLKENEALNSSKEKFQITTLTEMLKQKGAEIEEMKYQLERWSKIWSDPSKPPANETVTDVSSNPNNGTNKADNANIDSREGQLQLQESIQVGEGLRKKEEDEEEISGDAKMTKMEDSQGKRDTVAEISTSGDDRAVNDKDEDSATRENDVRNHEISDGRNLDSRRNVTKRKTRSMITREMKRSSEENGASESLQVEINNEGKPGGKLWRKIHRARKFEKNNDSQNQKNVKRMGDEGRKEGSEIPGNGRYKNDELKPLESTKEEVDSWRSSDTEPVRKEGEIVVGNVQLGSSQKSQGIQNLVPTGVTVTNSILQQQDEEVRRALGDMQNSTENEENAKVNTSEDMDFTYNDEDQTTEADDDELTNTN